MDGLDNRDVQLEPPIGTCYFKSYKYSVHGTIDVTFYVYVTLAKPTDKDFTAKGGKVYIVVVYDGHAGGWFPVNFDFGLSGLAPRVDQLPIPGSEVKQGDIRLYTIDFSQTMNMYNNGGNTGFTFPARYKRTYGIKGFIQSEYREMGWSLHHEKDAPYDEHLATNGLQIFETNRLEKVTCKLFYKLGKQSETNEFILDFSAETMSKAVVG